MTFKALLWFGVSVVVTIAFGLTLGTISDHDFFLLGPFALGFAFGAVMPGSYWIAPIGFLVGEVTLGMSAVAFGNAGHEPGHWPLYLTFLLWHLLFNTAGTGAGVWFYRWRSRPQEID